MWPVAEPAPAPPVSSEPAGRRVVELGAGQFVVLTSGPLAGRVLIAGGEGDFNVLSSAELYTPP